MTTTIDTKPTPRESRRINTASDALETRPLTPEKRIEALEKRIHSLSIEVNDLRSALNQREQQLKVEDFERRKAFDMAQNTALQRFGTREELAEVTRRVELNEAAADLNNKGVRLVAQISYMTGWIPFLDFHAVRNKKGKVSIVPDYKRLVQDSDPGNLSWSFRQMTPKERTERFVDTMSGSDRIIGIVCEMVEISKAKELAGAGLAHLYKPILGFATVNLDKDQTIQHRDPLKRGEIRALRDALNQTAKGQAAQDHFRAQLREASKTIGLSTPFVDPETGEDTVLLETPTGDDGPEIEIVDIVPSDASAGESEQSDSDDVGAWLRRDNGDDYDPTLSEEPLTSKTWARLAAWVVQHNDYYDTMNHASNALKQELRSAGKIGEDENWPVVWALEMPVREACTFLALHAAAKTGKEG